MRTSSAAFWYCTWAGDEGIVIGGDGWRVVVNGKWVSMKRNYTGIPLRMDGGQPGHANHAIEKPG
eukprot:COSAG01_NODE_875_length_12972_cov_61.925503_11_plen_65_part_00